MEFGIAALLSDDWIAALGRGSTGTTVFIAARAIWVLALVIGMLFGLVKWAEVPCASLLVDIYITFIRSVPELLVIYLFFFASEGVLTKIAAVFGYDDLMASVFPVLVAVLAIGLVSAAYATETAARRVGCNPPRTY